MGNRTTIYGITALLLLGSCVFSKPACPAYVIDPIQPGEYDYNGPYECSKWYEHRYGWMWSSYSKNDALELWATISNRPMYFEQTGEFRFTVIADDGFTYNFFALIYPADADNLTEYYITTDRPRRDWDKIPL